jgi:hypothetical protein
MGRNRLLPHRNGNDRVQPQITDIMLASGDVTVLPLRSGHACAGERVQDRSNLYLSPYATPCRADIALTAHSLQALSEGALARGLLRLSTPPFLGR